MQFSELIIFLKGARVDHHIVEFQGIIGENGEVYCEGALKGVLHTLGYQFGSAKDILLDFRQKSRV